MVVQMDLVPEHSPVNRGLDYLGDVPRGTFDGMIIYSLFRRLFCDFRIRPCMTIVMLLDAIDVVLIS